MRKNFKKWKKKLRRGNIKKCPRCGREINLSRNYSHLYTYPVYIDGEGYICGMCHIDLMIFDSLDIKEFQRVILRKKGPIYVKTNQERRLIQRWQQWKNTRKQQ